MDSILFRTVLLLCSYCINSIPILNIIFLKFEPLINVDILSNGELIFDFSEMKDYFQDIWEDIRNTKAD